MIQVSHVSRSYLGRPVLSDVTFSLSPGECVGLIGRNGCGKTTLLRILSSQEEAESGEVALAPDTTIGYLGQEGQLSPDRTLYQEMLDVFRHVFDLEKELRALENDMAHTEGDALKACLDRYAKVQASYDHAEGHLIDARIRTILAGVGFRPKDLDRVCREFSGGWQMRGAMARLLLQAPTLLLLDEPTNHLDVTAVEWLEEYLSEYAGTVVLVSHDRYFLDRTVSRIIEMKDGKVEEFTGNYTSYLEQSEARAEGQQAAYDQQQKKLEHDQKFIDRFRYKATLATRVKSREKMLDKMEKVSAPRREGAAIKVSFAASQGSGRNALLVKGVSKAYGTLSVLDGIDLKVEREDRIALVGPNGAGKSTLLRLMAGLEAPDSGTINPGFRLSPVYYAQHQAEALNPEHTVLEDVEEVAPRYMDQATIRTLLGCLLFRGDDVYKKVGVLSGGEKSRVALARCVVTPSNILFLDEPTNHLDITARESLMEALQDYQGTIVFISHDRNFMDGLATSILEMKDRHGVHHLGNYTEFRTRQDLENRRIAQLEAARAAEAARLQRTIRNGQKKTATRPHKTAPRQVAWTLEALEARIFEVEDEIRTMADRMAQPDFSRDAEAATQHMARYEALVGECEDLTQKWEEMGSAD